MYNIVFPAFEQFEIQRNISKVFDNPPKCYGTYTGHGSEVIVLQNLKVMGYDLWPKALPLPRNRVESVLKLYGRWHAISAAMQDQELKKFEKLVDNLHEFWPVFIANFTKTYASGREIVAKLFENDMDEDILNEFKQFVSQSEYPLVNLREKSATFNVITHGDCWNNNFMFKTTVGSNLEVAMIDWQASGFSSPVIDLAFFLYACVSKEDLDDFDDLSMTYYTSFAEHLTKLGSDPENIYTFADLLDDWKTYARSSIVLAIFIIYVFGNDNDLHDMIEAVEDSVGLHEALTGSAKNVDIVKNRSRHIIEHIVKRGFIKPIKYHINEL